MDLIQPMSFLLIGVTILLIGVAIGYLVWNPPGRRFTAGFAFLGLSIGLVVGLSSSPVVASTITAGFALVGTLLPYYLSTRGVVAGTPPPPPPPPLSDWLGPLACTLVVGLLGGITIRVNQLLYWPPEPRNLKEEYSAMGFSPSQVETILAGHAEALAKRPAGDLPEPAVPSSPVALLNAEQLAKLEDVLADAKAFPNADERLQFVEQQIPAVSLRVKQYRAEGKSAEQILELLRKMKTE